jgi:hypothetical protein
MNTIDYIYKLFKVNTKLIILGILLVTLTLLINSCNNDSLGLDSNVTKKLVTPDTIVIKDTIHVQVLILDTTYQTATLPGTIVPDLYDIDWLLTGSLWLKAESQKTNFTDFTGGISIIIDTTGTDIVIKNFYFNIIRLNTTEQKNKSGLYELAFNALNMDYSYATTDKYLPGIPWQNNNDWCSTSIMKSDSTISTYDGSQTKSKIFFSSIPVKINDHEWETELTFTTETNPDSSTYNSFGFAIAFKIRYNR